MARTKPAHDLRSDEQFLHEEAMTDVSDVLLCIEDAVKRARKALKTLGDTPSERNTTLALQQTVDSLTSVRKRLEWDTLYADPDSPRLL
ncbi:hypothetical protein [Dietzia sp. 179-F 9C3 NHS]|uniref:hypothetical protein n=1 Tax=Dietzia sp. 179-F 9C3 NHS TaxID=3374295 RepID=UPI0038799F37